MENKGYFQRSTKYLLFNLNVLWNDPFNSDYNLYRRRHQQRSLYGRKLTKADVDIDKSDKDKQFSEKKQVF